ncbi:thiol-disulfide isomerase/thioredoxin [Methylohalomonas lacus]|uniref:Thiol-disulfide isomerase/thioredoxin n=1 Tax=Methylohalomonas lacus TaxID=398773 RepID=A0AAE3L262_9GAMM|nr:TlpA disulfide reductase family protein [Methylohalomonas lacus]MCS3904555.1 thiol-disulfide isomerase/thioredoxin [Methylohalomonas lacus]
MPKSSSMGLPGGLWLAVSLLCFASAVAGNGNTPADPTLTLERLDGRHESLADTIGQGDWVIVHVWSPDCSLCVREMLDVIRFHRHHPGIPLIALTIDFPSFGYGRRESVQDYLQRQPLDFPLYLTDQAGVEELLGRRLVAIPLIAIFTPAGELVASWPGPIDAGEITTFIDQYDADTMQDELTEGF